MGKRAIAGAVMAAVVLAGCGGSGGSSSDEPAKTTTTAEATTTTTAVDTAAASEDYQDALEDVDAAIDDEIVVRDDFAAENDLDGAIDSSKDLRNALFDFDAVVREIEVPKDQQSAVNEVLTETGSYIEVLDDYLEVTDIPGYNDQLEAEAEARGAWYEAANALADDLEADGVDNEVDEGASASSDEPVGDEEVPAGEVVATSTASIEVPEGFTGTGVSTIELTGPNGVTAGLYSVFPESGTTIDEVAADSANGAAEKNDLEITAGPRNVALGDYTAVGYAFEAADGISILDFYFEAEDSAGNQWHVLTIEGPDSEIQDATSALQAVFPTLQIS